MPGVNVWGQVGAVVGYIPMSALTGAAGQLLGMDATAAFAEWKAATFLANQLSVPVGSVLLPSYTFIADGNTGMYQDGADTLGFTTGGAQRFKVSGAGVLLSVNAILNNKVLMEAFSANIVAAANIDLGTATGNYVYITNAAGDTTITRLGGTATLQAGTEMELKFKIAGGSVTLKNDINFLNLPGGSDLKVADGDICRFRKTNSADQFWDLTSYSKFQSLSITAAAQQPVTFIYPDVNDRPAMVAGGWLPWNLNQQWGGAGCMPFHMIDSTTGTEFKFDAFDGYLDDDGSLATVGNAAGNYYQYQVITPAKNLSLQAVWFKLFKTLNPVDNITVQLWSVAAGVPGALIATAGVINGKQITSDSNGQMYRFPFAVAQALVAGTQYMLVIFKSAGVDAANYYNMKYKTTTKYPNNLSGTGTIVPAWTPTNTLTRIFIAEAQASDQPIQSGGTFDGRIVGTEGNPINRSVAYNNTIRNVLPLFNPQGWSILIRGKTFTKDRTIAEFLYGLHHDRINIRSAVGTGFVTVTLYESDGTINTITGNNDVSTATYKDILITGRSLNDGADYLRIYTGVGGTWQKEVEAVAQSYLFDPLMLKLGTAWILGGFQLFGTANYTNFQDMSVLPSAAGYTFTGAAVEGSVFSVVGGKLNQIKAGYAAGNDGYYKKTAAAFVNATGYVATTKVRVVNGTNTKDETSITFQIEDGTKFCSLFLQEYYQQTLNSSINYYPQIDNRTADTTIIMSGKGSDKFVFANGRLIIDQTGCMTTGTANNQLFFGDVSGTANENSDVVWDYVGYSTAANVFPQFSSCELHEFAIFPGEQGTLGQALYNSGAPISIKQYCGIGKNFVGEQVVQKYKQIGITSSFASAAITYTVVPELEGFVIGALIDANTLNNYFHDTLGADIFFRLFVDGYGGSLSLASASGGEDVAETSNYVVNNLMVSTIPTKRKVNFGLHKIETRNFMSGGTITFRFNSRKLEINASAIQ